MNQINYELIMIIVGVILISVSVITGAITLVYSIIKNKVIKNSLAEKYGRPKEYGIDTPG